MANTATVIIYDLDLVLLQKRGAYAQRNPNLWGFFGGSLKDNEDPLEGVKREIFEELTYQLKNPEFFLEMSIEGDGKKFFFIEPYDKQQSLTLREGAEMRWFGINDLEDISMVPRHKVVLLHFFDKKSSREHQENS